MSGTRREFLGGAAALAGGAAVRAALGQEAGERPERAGGVEVVNPRRLVPVSLIIDDSTCLVNLAHFAIPQFHEAWPDRYTQDWRSLPREIPDDFVRKFADWCGEHGVRGKYSVVPYPACVGWMDRDLPGWSKRELAESLKLVRERLLESWDIHPEMVSHTWAIDVRTGRPFAGRTPEFMENWGWSQDKSADELTEYMAYALRILRNVDLPCEGITTPGGFANRNLANLSRATLESCRAVFGAEVPHYFRHLYTDERSVAPRVENAGGLGGDDPRCVVSIIGCTGDWFGGWDGLSAGSVERFITEDLSRGRMVEVIERGEPAVMVCHWPGIYFNGEEVGLEIFKEVVRRLERRYEHLVWMKPSEIARYWAARELTAIGREGGAVALSAPFATRWFTVRIGGAGRARGVVVEAGGERRELREVSGGLALDSGTFIREGEALVACFDLEKGESRVRLL